MVRNETILDYSRKILLEILCFAFILIFIYAGVSKLLDIHLFVVQIGQSKYLKPFANILAVLLPLLEIGISIAIAVTKWRRIGLYSFTFLMIVFTIFIIIILNFSSHIPCSCGGVLTNMGWRTHLIFNISLVTLGLIAIMLEKIGTNKNFSNETWVKPFKA